MRPKSNDYRLLYRADEDFENVELEKNYTSRLFLLIILTVLLILSILFNIVLITYGIVSSKHDCVSSRSKYANLIADQSLPFASYSGYSSSNFTLADQLWDAIDFDDGLVALPNEWTELKGLPDSAKFPWDNSKSIWLLNGYHDLHCVKRIYISLMEYRKNLPQSLPTTHITHCLDSLRDQIICNADDTPRFTHYRTEKGHLTGNDQRRQCRNWSDFEIWARKHNACYRYGDPTWDERSQYERFMYCPDDSPYLPAVKEFFEKATG